MLPSQRLGHYRVVEQIGAGGMGVVFRAHDEKLDRDVALKVLPAGSLADNAARQRFNQEALALSRLNHPHICTIYEVGESEGQTYIAMELVEGRPLLTLTRDNGLPIETAVRCGAQIASALDHAHDRGILHRDLKSSNVILTADGRAKVLDFGLAKRASAKEAEETRSKGLTGAGTVVGTLLYMAPEVLRGRPADRRSDLWALGVLLYEMVSGRLPFAGQTGFETISAILRESPAPLPPRVPAGLRTVIERCLAKEPGERYQRAGEVRAALETLQSSVAAALTSPAHSVSRRRWLWAGGTVGGVGVLAMVGVLMREYRQTPAGPRLSMGGTPSKNAEANEYFEKAMLFVRMQHDLPRAKQMIAKALDLDPRFAEARRWSGFMQLLTLASGFGNDIGLLYRAEEELRQALKDDPSLTSVHAAMAGVYIHLGRKDLVPGEVEKALKSKPNDPEALIWLVNYHRLNGDFEAAVTLARQMIEREPLFFPPRMNLGQLLMMQGDSAGAIREQQKILEQTPNHLFGVWFLSQAYLNAREAAKARAILERGRSADPKNYLVRQAWALLLALEGKREEALKEMDEDVLKFAAAMPNATLEAAEFYAVLGETAKALEWLDRAVRNGDERAEWFRRDPLLASIRNEPRFQQVVDSILYRRKQRANQ